MYYIIRASAVVRFYALHICAREYSLFMWWAFKQGKSNRDTFVDAHLSPFAEMKSAVLYQANMREIVCWAIIEIVCIYFHFFFYLERTYTLSVTGHTQCIDMNAFECIRKWWLFYYFTMRLHCSHWCLCKNIECPFFTGEMCKYHISMFGRIRFASHNTI